MKIGMRTIKTTFAIFLSTMIYFSLILIDKQFDVKLSSWFSPFFCAIAAGFSIQPGKNLTIQMGKRRAIGSLIGGCIGVVVVLSTLHLKNSGNLTMLFSYYLIVSLIIMLIVPITLKLKQKDAVFVTILTYCSVTLGIYYLPELQYCLNRIGSTLIGIAIACIISAYRFPRKLQTNTLFICAINTLLDKREINSKVRYKLNYLYDYNVDIIFTTDYSEAELDDILKDINIKNKLVVLNGAALYNSKKKTYHNVCNLTLDEKKDIDKILNDHNIFALRYVITNHFNKLNIFYNKDLPKHYIEIDESLEYDYTNANVLDETLVTQYHIIDTLDNIDKVKNLFNKYQCTIRKYDNNFYSLYINSTKTSKVEQIKGLNKTNKKIVSFVYNDDALSVLTKEIYCVNESSNEIKNISTEVLKDNNCVVNKIKQLYFKR